MCYRFVFLRGGYVVIMINVSVMCLVRFSVLCVVLIFVCLLFWEKMWLHCIVLLNREEYSSVNKNKLI